jgi:hypothetical protein
MVDADMADAGLRTFFRIAERWKLTDDEQLKLLGLQDLSSLVALRSGASTAVSRDMLERISYILGIFRAINILLPRPDRADGWVTARNSSQVFGGGRPVDLMASGKMDDLRQVRRYLEAQQVDPNAGEGMTDGRR